MNQLSVQLSPGVYRVATGDDEVIERALAILEARLAALPAGEAITSPKMVRDYLRLRLANKGHEVFAVLFLDAQHHVVAYEEMFRGTLTQTSVYPREVARAALAHGAAAVVLAHNHPSGVAEPSRADEYLTRTLKSALALLDVRVLDHVVIGDRDAISFAERGLL